MEGRLDALYVHGDIYAALNICEELEINLNVLRRQQLISEAAWTQARKSASEIRSSLEAILVA